MLSPEVRARLARLNRAPLPQEAPGRPTPAEPPRIGSSDAALAGGREIDSGQGACFLIRRPIVQLWPRADESLAPWRRRLDEAMARDAAHPELSRFAVAFPAGVMCLDLETCGLGSAMVFLIGLIRSVDGRLSLDQYFARHYAEERAILATLWSAAAEHQVLVTFNGKSFDWPVVQDRSVYHRLSRTSRPAGGQRAAAPRSGSTIADDLFRDPSQPSAPHCDILHHARRRYRDRLANCKLQTLERFVCGRMRRGDIPGSEIPEAYHRYVRTGEDSQIETILHHNALDLITLLQLSLHLCTPATQRQK